MAITLGTARQFAVEAAYDMADDKADRLAIKWIRAALQRCWRSHDWRYFRTTQRIACDRAATGTDLTATQDSAAISRTSAWVAGYATYGWDLLSTDDADKVYNLSAIGTPTTNATLGTGQVWLGAGGSSLSYTMTRYRYALPDSFVRRTVRVEELETKRVIMPLAPDAFDALRHSNPGRQGVPEFYLIRRAGEIEFHPAPADTRRAIQLTYTRKVTLPALADADNTTVDWPEEFEDVLWRAIEVEAARHQGDAAQIKYEVCYPEFHEAIASARALDGDMGHVTRRITLEPPASSRRGRFGRFAFPPESS